MEWNWLAGLLYGTLGGFFEFLPVSSYVHQKVLLKLAGLSAPGMGMSLAVHLGMLAAVVFSYYNSISKLNREQKIKKQPKNRRKRQPDVVALVQLRMLKISAVPLTLMCLVMPWLGQFFDRLWLLAILTALSGVVVLLPHYMTQGNKNAKGMSPLDATLVGLGGVLGALPGFSKVGVLTSVASMRGMDRQFSLDFTYLLSIPALIALCVGEAAMLIFTADPRTGSMFFIGVLASVASFATGIVGIKVMRFLSVKTGYEEIAYYSWGLSMFAFIIYLIG